MRWCDSFRGQLFSGFCLGLVQWGVFGFILYIFLRHLLYFLYRLRWLRLRGFLGEDLGFGGTFGNFKELLNAKCQKVVFNLKRRTLIKALLVETITDQTSHSRHLGVWDGRQLLRDNHCLGFL